MSLSCAITWSNLTARKLKCWQRERIVCVGRGLSCLGTSIGVRQRRSRRRLQCFHVDPRLDEHEPLILLLAQLTFELRTSPRLLLRRHLKDGQPGPQDDGENQESVDDNGKDDAFPPRDGAANDQLVLIATVDVEVNQTSVVRPEIITLGFAMT